MVNGAWISTYPCFGVTRPGKDSWLLSLSTSNSQQHRPEPTGAGKRSFAPEIPVVQALIKNHSLLNLLFLPKWFNFSFVNSLGSNSNPAVEHGQNTAHHDGNSGRTSHCSFSGTHTALLKGKTERLTEVQTTPLHTPEKLLVKEHHSSHICFLLQHNWKKQGSQEWGCHEETHRGLTQEFLPLEATCPMLTFPYLRMLQPLMPQSLDWKGKSDGTLWRRMMDWSINTLAQHFPLHFSSSSSFGVQGIEE